jgi:predicted transglutaminase-like cysteine proteinase
MTNMARDDAFAKLKGKTVMLRGKVREIGKTAISDEVYVSLTVGQLDMMERINVQFNVRESLVEKVRMWNKDEVHTMRGRIASKGDLEDDAKCDIAEIVE